LCLLLLVFSQLRIGLAASAVKAGSILKAKLSVYSETLETERFGWREDVAAFKRIADAAIERADASERRFAKELEESKIRFARLEKELADSRRRFARLEKELDDSRMRFADSKRRIDLLERKLLKHHELEEDVERLQDEMLGLRNKVERLECANERLRTDNRSLRDEVTGLTVKIAHFDATNVLSKMYASYLFNLMARAWEEKQRSGFGCTTYAFVRALRVDVSLHKSVVESFKAQVEAAFDYCGGDERKQSDLRHFVRWFCGVRFRKDGGGGDEETTTFEELRAANQGRNAFIHLDRLEQPGDVKEEARGICKIKVWTSADPELYGKVKKMAEAVFQCQLQL